MSPARSIYLSCLILLMPFLLSEAQERADSTRFLNLLEEAGVAGRTDTSKSFGYMEEAWLIAENLDRPDMKGLFQKSKGDLYSSLGKYDKAILHYDQALSFFKESDDQDLYYLTIKDKGNAYLHGADFEQAMNHYRRALDYYKRTENMLGISRCLNNMGIVYKNHGAYVEALSVYKESLMLLDSTVHFHDLAQSHINMGNIFVYLGSYSKALFHYMRALELSEREGIEENIVLCLGNSGVVQNKLGEFGKALMYYERSLELTDRLNNPIQYSNILINMGTNYASMEDYDNALVFVKKGLEIKQELGDERGISSCQLHLASIYIMIEEVVQAEALYRLALEEKLRLGDPEGLIRCYMGLGDVAVMRQDYREAEELIDRALELADELGIIEYKSLIYRIKRDLAIERGDYKSGYEYSMQHHRYTDSLFSDAATRSAMEMEFRSRARILEQEVENLQIQANLDRLEMRKRTFILHSSIVVAIVLLISLTLVIYFMRRSSQTSAKLAEKNLLITRQNLTLNRMNKSRDRIMSTIAHDLRGTIGNQLIAVEVLEQIEGKEDAKINRKSLLSNLGKSASYSLQLLENLLHWSRLQDGKSHYHPEEVNLAILLRSSLALYTESARQKKIDLKTIVNDDFSCFADRMMMEAIFRNLVSNAVKFSHSGGKVEIKLFVENAHFNFSVRDEGVGMSEEEIIKIQKDENFTRRGTDNEKGAGMGLTLVREFTQLHCGEFIIHSEEGKGSTFAVIIPCIN